MKINSLMDTEFRKYGRVLEGYDCGELMAAMAKTELPGDVIYVPSDPEMEKLQIFKELTDKGFGGIPIQLGYCNGRNKKLNAVEYHRSSEINVACTDLVLLLGMQQDISPANYTYDTSKIEAFLVPAGTVIEVYATTLHYAPCNVSDEGFRAVVVLPKDTNLELAAPHGTRGEDALLFARNKWLIGHPETDLGAQGAFVGLKGENVSI